MLVQTRYVLGSFWVALEECELESSFDAEPNVGSEMPVHAQSTDSSTSTDCTLLSLRRLYEP